MVDDGFVPQGRATRHCKTEHVWQNQGTADEFRRTRATPELTEDGTGAGDVAVFDDGCVVADRKGALGAIAGEPRLQKERVVCGTSSKLVLRTYYPVLYETGVTWVPAVNLHKSEQRTWLRSGRRPGAESGASGAAPAAAAPEAAAAPPEPAAAVSAAAGAAAARAALVEAAAAAARASAARAAATTVPDPAAAETAVAGTAATGPAAAVAAAAEAAAAATAAAVAAATTGEATLPVGSAEDTV